MTEQEFVAKFNELAANEEFTASLKGLRNKDDIRAKFCEHGLELTDEMLDGITAKLATFDENGEIDEETLALVAGGKSFKGFLGSVGAGAALGAGYGGWRGAIVGGVIGGVAYWCF